MKILLFKLFKKLARLLSGKGLGKLPILGYLWRLISILILEKTRPEHIFINNHLMFLDNNDSLGLSVYGVYEVDETKLFNNIIKEYDVVVDIGANIGYYTLLAAKKVGPSGRVIAFEPDPVNYLLLKKNIIANKYNNVVLVNKAVSDESCVLPLFLSSVNNGDHRLYDDGGHRDFVNVDSISLDEYFKDNYKVDFIKIDAQGAEGRILKGMKNVINCNKRLKILTEFWPDRLRACGVDPKEYIFSIQKYGFEAFDVEDRDFKNKLDYSKLIKDCSKHNFQKNILFVR